MTDILDKVKKEMLNLKYMMVGTTGVGKSSILTRYIDNSFNENGVSTTGIDFRDKKIKLKEKTKTVKVQLWDTSGQDTFKSACTLRLKVSNAIICVYDMENFETFDELREYWIPQAEQNCPVNTVFAVYGNKSDKVPNPAEIKQKADLLLEELSKTLNIELLSFAGSCKDEYDTSIEEMFTFVTNKIYVKVEEEEREAILLLEREKLVKPPSRNSVVLTRESLKVTPNRRGWCHR